MSIYRRLLSYIWPYRIRFAIACVAMILYAFFNVLVSATLYVIFNGFFNRGEVVISDLPYLEIQGAIRFSAIWVPFLVVFVFLFRGFFEFLSNYLMSNIGLRAIMNIRNDLYSHLTNQSIGFFTKGRTGDLISRIMNDVSLVQAAITEVVVDLLKQPLIILLNIPMAFLWGGKLAAISLIVFPAATVPIILLGRRLRKITRKMQERQADITSILEETFTGIRIVKGFNMEEREIQKFGLVNRKVFDFFRKMLKVTVIQRPLIEVMGAAGAAIAIWFGYQLLPPDRFVAFIGAMFVFYDPLKKLSKVNSAIQQAIGAGSRIFEIIDTKPVVQERILSYPFEWRFREIAFRNLSFSYDGQKKVLEEIDFSVPAGELIAIVGASGAGKTTLVNLIPRFYDPAEGQVEINGEDIRNFTLKSLRSGVGIVTQETILFNDTVRENIAYGKPAASLDEIRQAAEAAYCDEFISALPEGYETRIGERGVLLSGGQRQRLAIARAILKNPPILILDEATSQLDSESERVVQQALENLMRGKTVFVIAHRLSTVQRADRILVLEAGRIVQEGTNASLLAESGPYRRLYDLQFNL